MRINIPSILTLLLLSAGGGALAEKSHDAAVARSLNTFNSLVKEIELNYVDSVRVEEGFKAAIGAYLSTIDPYTEFYDADDRENLLKMTTGEYGGIGSYILERDNATFISAPMEGSPAAQAGLKAGDRIVRVDSTDTRTLRKGLNVSKLLRGIPGTTVNVRVIRPFVEDSVIDVAIERRKLQEPSVPYHKLYDDGTGYIRLTSFIESSPREIEKALKEFASDPALKNVVLDLRGNGGGLLESAVEILGFFLPKDTEVLRTRGKDPHSEKIYKTRRSPLMPDIPLAVLIDGGSASASEITAGAIQDLDRGVLLGTRSFGKGLVQGTFQLPYESLVKVTTAKYYIPSGRLIQALDYSHRNPDGTVARTPDSLTNVYRTLHGREVRDGGGLTPDVEVEWETPSRLAYNVVRDNWAFDYATRFAASHPEVAPPEEFVITDEMYEDFKKGIDPGKFKYDKVCEDLMKRLREAAKSEGYMNPEVESRIDSLAAMLTHDLTHDLDTRREEISSYLAEEILGRYYYDRGRIVEDLKRDPGLRKAREILSDREEYSRLLGRKEKK